MQDIDLTPFGFTPTENLAYGALLELGPSSGYALAKELSIARANAYQALNGLVAKGAATASGDQPQRYRAVRPDAVLARIVATESRKLDALESQIRSVASPGGDAMVELKGSRGLLDIALRTIARETGEVTCLASAETLGTLAPAWRRRAMDSRASSVWIIGEDTADLAVDPAGTIDASRSRELFGGPVFLLLAGDTAVVAIDEGDGTRGYWTTDITIVGAVTAAVQHLTGKR
jgi:sugar-specific transcriptional regulator TrmB